MNKRSNKNYGGVEGLKYHDEEVYFGLSTKWPLYLKIMRLAWLMLEGSVRKNVIDNPLNSDFHKFYISQSIYFVDRCKKI